MKILYVLPQTDVLLIWMVSIVIGVPDDESNETCAHENGKCHDYPEGSAKNELCCDGLACVKTGSIDKSEGICRICIKEGEKCSSGEETDLGCCPGLHCELFRTTKVPRIDWNGFCRH